MDDDGQFWVFEKRNSRHGIERRSPKGTFWEKDANTRMSLDGVPDTIVEEFFNHAIENPAAESLDLIAHSEDPIGVLKSDSHRFELTKFVVAQVKRAQSMQNVLDDEAATKILNDTRAEAKELIGRPLREDEMRLFSPDTNSSLINHARVSARMEYSGEFLPRLLNGCGLSVVEAPPKKSFILGSEPFLRFGGELGKEGAELVLTVSPNRCLVWSSLRVDKKHLRLADPAIRRCNLMIWQNSDTVASKSKPLIESLRRTFKV